MDRIEREIDKLGRIVLPIGYRRMLGLSENAKVTLFLQNDMICIAPVATKCLICKSNCNINQNLKLCFECINRIKEEG